MKNKKMVSTGDDWLPNHPGGMVEVSLHKDGKAHWRVAIWGADDFGMEKGHLYCVDAFDLYRSLTGGLTVAELTKVGFVRA